MKRFNILFFSHKLWIDIYWASSLDRGESVHGAIPISPLDIKNVSLVQRGNIMLVSWIYLPRQNLRHFRPWVAPSVLSLSLSFVSQSFHPVSLLYSILWHFFKDLLHISLFFSLSVSPHPPDLPEYNCCDCTDAIYKKKKYPELKFHLYKKDIVTNPQGNWGRLSSWPEAFRFLSNFAIAAEMPFRQKIHWKSLFFWINIIFLWILMCKMIPFVAQTVRMLEWVYSC